VTVVLLAIGKRELECFRDDVDVARGVVSHPAQIEAREHAERLHQDGALRPRRLAEDVSASKRHGERRLGMRTECRKVARAQETAEALGERSDHGGDGAAIETLAGGGGARGAVGATARSRFRAATAPSWRRPPG